MSIKTLKDFKAKNNKGRKIDFTKVLILGIAVLVIGLIIWFMVSVFTSGSNIADKVNQIISSSETVDDLDSSLKTASNDMGFSYKIDNGDTKGTYVVSIQDDDGVKTYNYIQKETEKTEKNLDVDESKLSSDELQKRNTAKQKICNDVSFALSNNKIIDTLVEDLNDIKKDAENENISFEYEISDKLNNDYVLKTVVGGTVYRNSFTVKEENAKLKPGQTRTSEGSTVLGENNDSNSTASTASIASTASTGSTGTVSSTASTASTDVAK